ncbi:MAG: hypothetical protein ACFFEU_14820 [Candidatus Thorarchaeota archaeon]|jgi:hypothetical protein
MEREDGESEKTPCEEVLLDRQRGRLRFNKGLILRQPLRFLRAVGPLLTAHHPFCSVYEGHIFTLRGRKWCIGCFFNSLSFFIALGLLIVSSLVVPFVIDLSYLFWGGAVFTLISFAMSALRLTENRKLKVLSKLILGSSFACISWAILLADGLMTNLEMKFALIFSLYLIVVLILGFRRVVEVEKECKACEYVMRWSRCPGFKGILCPLIDHKFLYPESPSQSICD